MASLFSLQETSKQIGAEPKQPLWYQNSARRVIPNHLVPRKRLAFQLSGTSTNKKDSKQSATNGASSNNNAFNSTDFNLISFGNTAHRTSSAGHGDSLSLFLTADGHDISQSFDTDDIPLYNENEDLPPAKSLYDLNDEVVISLNKPQQHTESFINKDPKTFVNAFHQKSDVSSTPEEDPAAKLSPLLISESAILVFGYPEAMTSQIIGYFSDFGTILEHFEALKNRRNENANILLAGTQTSSSSSGLPLFSGNSWVKLTFDNPASAQDALKESGSVFNGVLIGVVPYTKDAIEKLQKRKLSPLEDIGGGFQLLTRNISNEVDKGVAGDTNDLQASYIKRLDVKDGTGLFLKANGTGAQSEGLDEKGKGEKLGLLASVTKYFFGFHDL
ncbi:MPPN-domain-containing protein [Metschnikowia bicuspidata var. bicuspidata NRRL YB-4993]|uniref:MPPN-domain-containing protein n=1 Tax=Metschnikowia bicuspidata var. bicuspidata NRRL YB-4993 TaxID=869754 RepID=A0A1A0HH85_9ASCO|nr:MPPN-domain-containing protein [Metschnikowia bicuspidata var. bicuspidata NRRL YB-4993]OBA23360.1 MPPN-domain-containing protein [Metschnikowia bicuspidata var. bicuspidata NRRL YB-4993]